MIVWLAAGRDGFRNRLLSPQHLGLRLLGGGAVHVDGFLPFFLSVWYLRYGTEFQAEAVSRYFARVLAQSAAQLRGEDTQLTLNCRRLPLALWIPNSGTSGFDDGWLLKELTETGLLELSSEVTEQVGIFRVDSEKSKLLV